MCSGARSPTVWAPPTSAAPWTLTGTASGFSVAGGAGHIAGAVRRNRAAFLAAVRQRDFDVTTDLGLDHAPTGGGVYVSLIGRRVSNGNDYRLHAPLHARRFRHRLPGPHRQRHRDHRRQHHRDRPDRRAQATCCGQVAVTGTTTTTMRAKVWRPARTEPQAGCSPAPPPPRPRSRPPATSASSSTCRAPGPAPPRSHDRQPRCCPSDRLTATR